MVSHVRFALPMGVIRKWLRRLSPATRIPALRSSSAAVSAWRAHRSAPITE